MLRDTITPKTPHQLVYFPSCIPDYYYLVSILILLFAVVTTTNAMYVDDAGLLDFIIPTTGHGPQNMQLLTTTKHGSILISYTTPTTTPISSSSSSSSSCYIAGRNTRTGSLLWRRDACYSSLMDSSSSSSSSNSNEDTITDGAIGIIDVTTIGDVVVTLAVETKDGMIQMIVRGWDVLHGSLLYDISLDRTTGITTSNNNKHIKDHQLPGAAAEIWSFTKENVQYIAVSGAVDTTTTSSSSNHRRNTQQSPVVVLNANTGSIIRNDNNILNHNNEDMVENTKHRFESSNIAKCYDRTITLLLGKEKNHTADDSTIVVSRDGSTTTATTSDVVSSSSSSTVSYTLKHGTFDEVNDHITLLTCTERSASIIVTSKRGTTTQITILTNSTSTNTDRIKVKWQQEEGLSHISSAIMLDASHEDIIRNNNNQNETDAASILQFQSRLQLQWKSMQNMFLPFITTNNNNNIKGRNSRDYGFGFVKIAVMISDTSHRVYGIETAGTNRSKIRYQIDLPYYHYTTTTTTTTTTTSTKWHRMVHGSINTKSSAHGVNGRASTRDVLILTYSSNIDTGTETTGIVDWVCFDGTSGSIHNTGTRIVSSPVVQIIPISAASTSITSGYTAAAALSSSCRQNALLMLQDQSIVDVFDNNAGNIIPDNLYTHIFDKSTSTMQSFGIVRSPIDVNNNNNDNNNVSIEAHLVGTTTFPGEDIIAVAYPSRDEVVASPCEILGDDSLLLKYLNPHLVVIITMTSPDAKTTTNSDDEFQLSSSTTQKSQKRKPAGVTTNSAADTTTKATEKPNLFISLVDTVSGRVMYRTSHTNAVPYPRPNVIVSENWIFYTFSNGKTRKAELGVLTLYEGMIDKKSLTAFTSPEHLTTFSSLDVRENRPVVLAKTYTLPMAVTAMGVTSTRSGISARKLLLAGIDGQIHGVDRKILEPRRPLGPLKDAEKKEGLMQYHELIHVIPYQSLTYNQTVHGVKSIISVQTDLESQSLVLAIGGADIFFTRTSPSKGFDLLPDNFNKLLLLLVVVALVGIMIFLQMLVSRKIRKQGWI